MSAVFYFVITCWLYFFFFQNPISVAYGNVVVETYAEVAAYLIGAMVAVGLVLLARAFCPFHRT
jgi:hypothetical protein